MGRASRSWRLRSSPLVVTSERFRRRYRDRRTRRSSSRWFRAVEIVAVEFIGRMIGAGSRSANAPAAEKETNASTVASEIIAIKEIRDFLSLRRPNLTVIKIRLRSRSCLGDCRNASTRRNERIGFGRDRRTVCASSLRAHPKS